MLGQRLFSPARQVHVIERDRRPAIRAQPFEESDQPIDRDRVPIEIALEIDDIVKGDAGKAIRRAHRREREKDEQEKQGAAWHQKRRLRWMKPSVAGVGPPSYTARFRSTP